MTAIITTTTAAAAATAVAGRFIQRRRLPAAISPLTTVTDRASPLVNRIRPAVFSASTPTHTIITTTTIRQSCRGTARLPTVTATAATPPPGSRPRPRWRWQRIPVPFARTAAALSVASRLAARAERLFRNPPRNEPSAMSVPAASVRRRRRLRRHGR